MKRVASLILLVVTLVLASVGIAGLLYSPDLTIPPGTAGTRVEAGGIQLRVLQEGQGRDILMIHGSPGILEDFDEPAARLRDSFRITRYDRPGHGYSADSGQYSVDYNARIALALIEKLGLEHTVVVGHSFGGSTALALALMKSPRVAAVVTLDSAVYEPIRAIKPAFRFVRLPVFGIGLARALPASRRQAMVGEALANEFKVAMPAEPFRSLRMRIYAEPKDLHATANEHWYSAAELARQNTHYGEIGVPVHVVAERDDPARRATAERLQKDTGGGELLLVSPSGHYVHIEQAGAVADLIRRVASAN
jgi:pimeloyl-ACP methyl ester carboxylesterase